LNRMTKRKIRTRIKTSPRTNGEGSKLLLAKSNKHKLGMLRRNMIDQLTTSLISSGAGDLIKNGTSGTVNIFE